MLERAAEVGVGRGIRLTVWPDEIVVKASLIDSTASTPTILSEVGTALFLAARDLDPEWRYLDTDEPVN